MSIHLKRFLIGCAVAGLTIIGFSWWASVAHAPVYQTQGRATIRVGSVSIDAEIVDTPESRERGLSGKASLTDGEGMLFVFPVDDLHSFWMKDMNFSIDMIWLDSSKRVVHIAENASPESYPETTFEPETAARYVLEVPAGWSARNGVAVGAVMEW